MNAVTGTKRVAAAVGRAWMQVRHPDTLLMLKHFGLTFIFKALSLIITLVIYVICVRELGVVTWGQIALISSAANIMLIPLTFGLHNGVIKHVPVSTEEERREIIGTAFIANVVPSTIVTILLIGAGPLVEDWFGFPTMHWLAAVAIAMSINLYILTESFLRGQQLFYRMGILKLLSAIVFLAGTLIGLYGLGVTSMLVYIAPVVAQHIFFFFSAMAGSGLMPMKFSFSVVKKLYTYGLFVMLSWFISTLLFTSDLFLIAYFGEQYELGVYSIYQNSIRGLCTILFHDVFAVVFMPMIASMNRRHIDGVIMRYCIPLFVVIWLGAAILTIILVLLYGESVPLDWTYVSLTSAGIAMNMMYLLMTTVISMDGVKAARSVFAALVIPIPILLWLQYMFVKAWGMLGGMSSVIVLNLCLLIALRITIRFFYQIQSVPKEGEMSV